MLDTMTQQTLLGSPGNYPSWVIPPEGFIPVDRNRSLSVALGSGVTILETIQLTESWTGWIVRAGIFASSYTGFFFQILEGGSPLRDYNRITVPLGQSDNTDIIGPLKIKANIPLQLVCNAGTVAGPAIGIRYRLWGWYFRTL